MIEDTAVGKKMYVLQEKAETLVYGYTLATVKYVQYKTLSGQNERIVS